MSRNALRHPVLVVSVVAALGAASVAPAAVASTTPAPAPASSVSTRGLLDGLLSGLTTPVKDLVTGLLTTPTTGALPTTTVTDLTGALTTLPPALVTQLLGVLTPAQLQQLVTTDPTSAVTSLLGGLLGTVTDLASGATAGGTSVPTVPVIGDALSQLSTILAGGLPTTTDGLATLTSLLNQVTTLLGVPGVTALPIVGPLVTQLTKTLAALPDGPTKTAVAGAITAATKSAGIDPSVLAAALALLGLGSSAKPTTSVTAPATGVKPAASTTTAKGVARARISSVKVSHDRRTIKVRILCPTSSPTGGCRVITSVKLAGRAAKVTRTTSVRHGATRTLTAKVPASVARTVRSRGGRLVVKVGTSGAASGALKKTQTLRRTAR